jgi:spore coat polysaccharide biosynthesis protein SpsF
MNITTIIQARRGSTRLPDKVMLPLAEKPLLVRMVERVLMAKLVGTVVVATTTDAQDDIIEQLCVEHGFNCFRGHPTDLLDRHYQAALQFGGDTVIKIPSDCPLIDATVIDEVIQYYIDNKDNFDFVSNLHPASYPDGNDVEIMPLSVLEIAREEATLHLEREHTTPFIWERPQRFRIGSVLWESGLDYSMSHRFTIDYKEDYLFIKEVYDNLYLENPNFGLTDILNLLENNPSIYEINSVFAGVNWYRNHLNELNTVDAGKTKVI